jgi:parallel beta-helix repeat protein
MKKFYAFLLMAAVAAGAMAQDFVSDGTGTVYTFNSLSQIEGTGVTLQDDGSYLVAADFTISEGDVLQMDNNAVIKMANGVRIYINGDADFAPADTAVVTRDAEDSNPKGFWMMGDNGNANLKNVTFEYVGVTFGGVNSSLHADNCTFTLYNGKMNSSGALGFNASCDNNIVENCYFIENTLNAIGNGATNPVGIIIRNCLFWHNTTDNRNKPQINLTVGGDYDVLIADNEVIGGQFTMSGGIALSNMMGLAHTGTNIVENNYIADNRYGITTIGSVDAIIRNNSMVDNHYETNPNNGGSCISIYDSSSSSNIYIEGNLMEGGFWGITIVTGAPNVNLGKTEDPEAEDYNPGNNIFVNNGFDGAYYDVYNNGTCDVWAQGNTWNVEIQDEASIEEVVYHQVDDPSKGLVIFMPPHQDPPSAVEELNAQQADGLYYNLMGMPSEAPAAPGIYIHNGKKILVK